jgi:hypothetical protein
MDIRKQQAIAELIAGNIFKHSFYVSNVKDSIAGWKEMDNIPYFLNSEEWFGQVVDKVVASAPGHWVAVTMSNDLMQELNVQIPVSQYTPLIFKLLQSGTKTIGEIYETVKSEVKGDFSMEIFEKELDKYCPMFVEIGALYLRHKSILKFPEVR